MFYIFALFCLSWWHLTGVFGESVSVTEGDSVTLQTDTQIHEDNDILWKFGPETSLIAKIIREKLITPDERFTDRLKLDRQTGSLTIMNITSEHSGDYEVKITGAKRTTKTFIVKVYTRLPVPVLIRNSSSSVQHCSVVCSVVNVSAVSLSWYKGNSVLSSISVSDLSISLSLPLEVEYQDKNTYSCVINNTISNQTTHLDTNKFIVSITDEGIPLLYIVLISAVAFLLIIASLVMCCFCRKSKKTGR